MRWQPPTLTDERRRRIIQLLSAPERARWEAAASGEPGDRFLVGRMLLRELSAESLQIPLEAVTVLAVCPSCGGPHGRPDIIVDGAIPLRAGLSHTAGLVVAAVLPATRGSAMGIDVEAVAGSSERRAAIDALVPPDLRGARGARGHGHGTRGALRAWTRVEAVLKADGRGLRVDPRAVTLQWADGRLAVSVDGSEADYTVFDRGIGGRGLRRGAVLSIAIAEPVSGPTPGAGRAARSSTARP